MVGPQVACENMVSKKESWNELYIIALMLGSQDELNFQDRTIFSLELNANDAARITLQLELMPLYFELFHSGCNLLQLWQRFHLEHDRCCTLSLTSMLI